MLCAPLVDYHLSWPLDNIHGMMGNFQDSWAMLGPACNTKFHKERESNTSVEVASGKKKVGAYRIYLSSKGQFEA